MLLVVFTPTYTPFGRSFAKRKHTERCGFFGGIGLEPI